MSLTPGQLALGDQCKAESDGLVDAFIEAAKTYVAGGGEMTESFGLCGTATVDYLAESEDNHLQVAYMFSAAVHRLAFPEPEQVADDV